MRNQKERKTVPYINSMKKEYKSKIVCSKCKGKRVPLLTIIKFEPFEIRLVCRGCDKRWSRPLKSMEEESLRFFEDEEVMGCCLAHPAELSQFYCTGCQLNFCKICEKLHKDHKEQLKILAELPSRESFSSEVEKAKDFFRELSKNVEQWCIYKKIDKNILEKFIKRNEDIFDFIELLQFNYNKNIYETFINLNEHTKFTFEPINLKKGDEEIIDIIQSYTINNATLDESEGTSLNTDNTTLFFIERSNTTIRKTRTLNPKKSVLNNMKLEKQIKYETGMVFSISAFTDGRLVSGSLDSMLRVYTPPSYACTLAIKAHKKYINYVTVLQSGYVASASGDKTIKIWEIKKKYFQLVKIVKIHKNSVTKVIQLKNDKLCSCSWDKNIIVFRGSSPFPVIKEMKGHKEYVRSVIQSKDGLYIISGDHNELVFWDSKTYKMLSKIINICCHNNNSLLELEADRKILVGGCFCKVFLVSIDNRNAERVFNLNKGRGYVDSLVSFYDNTILFSCSAPREGIFVHYNLDKEAVISEKKDVHKSYIGGLLFFKEKLFSCSEDGTIKIWNMINEKSCTIC